MALNGIPGEAPEAARAERAFEIANRLGLHARAAAKLVHLANQFSAEIRLEKDGMEVNAKSIMGVLMLAAPREAKIVVRAEGRDAVRAVEALGEMIAGKFGEE